MQIVIIGLLAVVAGIVFVALARHFGGRALVVQIQAALGSGLNRAQAILDHIYLAIIVPAFKRLGRVAMATLSLGTIGSFLLWCCGDTLKWWVWFVALIIAAGSIAWLVVQDLKVRSQYDIPDCLTAIFCGLLSLGVWLFIAAALCVGQMSGLKPVSLVSIMDARSLAILGMVYILMAREVLFVTLDLLAHMAKLGVDFAEGSSNLLVGIAKKLATQGVKGLSDVDVNIADQELFEPAIKHAKKRVNTALYPVLALGVLMPYPSVLFFAMLVGAVMYAVYGNLEANDIDTTSRRQRAAKTLEVLSYVMLVLVGLVVFVPALQSEFDTLIIKIGALLVGVVRTIVAGIEWVLGIKSHTFTGFPWYAAVLGALFAGTVAYFAWPRDAETVGAVRRVRQIVAVPFMALALAGICSLTLTIFTWGNADSIGVDSGVTLSKMTSPKVELVQGPAVRLSYPEIARASGGYVYQRRTITDTTWTSIGNVSDGIVHFDDTSVTPGTTYAYRVAATFASGQKEFSKEVLVSVPKPAVAGSGTGGSGGGPGTRTACTNCGNPGLTAYCQDHPDVCAKRQ